MALDNVSAPERDAHEDSSATAALLDAVQSFTRHEIAPRCRRPEHALTAADFSAIAQAANAAGLLDAGAAGYGFWSELAQEKSSWAFTLAALRMIAAVDSRAAWQLHGIALAHAAQLMAGIKNAGNTPHCTFTLDGTHGIGRSALGRWLAGHTLHDRDREMLADTFGDRARVALLAPGTTQVAALRWQDDGFALVLHNLAQAGMDSDPHPHGFDGCHSVRFIAAQAPAASGNLARNDVALLLAAQQLAQLAMARGTLQRAVTLAQDYTVLRRQGARMIARHDAVALLLAEMETGCATLDALLRDAACDAGGTPVVRAARALALRREALPLLKRSANAAMQVHGGSGYMRDTGIESVLRDVNTLALSGGCATELALLATGLATHAFAEQAALPEQHDNSEDHLPGHLPATHLLSPATAFARVPLLRLLANNTPVDPWEYDTRTLPRPLAQLRRRVRQFAGQHCAPLAAGMDREQRDLHAHTPALATLLQHAGRAGLLTDILPAPFGSAPIAQFAHSLAFQQALRVEELARVDGGLMLLLSAHSLGLCPLLLSGDLRLLRRVVLPAFRASEAGDPHLFAFAITEPAAGSDAEEGHGALHQHPGVVATPAAQQGKRGWRLRGRKIFISGGDIARYIAVFAALDSGQGNEGYASWTCFLVDTRSPGFRVARNEMKMGMRASAAAELEFNDCFVADDMIVGGLRNGWALARATLNLSRLPVAAMGVGFAQQAVDIATGFACRETLAGRPLVHYRHVQATLADLQAETGAIRQLVWHHARGWRPRQDGAALCKFQATDRAQVVVEAAMDLLGNAAIQHENRIERTFRDVRLTRIFEGTNQINRLAVIEDQQALLLARIAAFR